MQELNVNWSKVAHKNKIWDHFKGWEENHNLSIVYNTDNKEGKVFQPGATGLISKGKLSHTWSSSGVDKTKLGRWAWSRFQGSYGQYFRLVSVYRPCYNIRYNSAYMQQYRYAMKYKNGICPREMFLGI